MFLKGTMKDRGVDITIKNNPGHVLAPDDWDMVRKVKLRKISPEEYKVYYANLLRERWEDRKEEIKEFARQGVDKDVKLKCFCSDKEKHCHAHLASNFLNNVIKKVLKNGS